MSRIFWLLLLLPCICRAEFGWMPPEKNLDLKFGFEYLNSSSNYDTTGSKVPIVFASDLVKASENRFYVDPEYSFAEDWSAHVRLGFLTSNISTDTGTFTGTGTSTYLSGSGIGDILLGIKHRFRRTKPGLIAEFLTVFPTYGRTVQNRGVDMVIGDGSVDLQIFLHGSYSMNRFFFAFSPNILFRTGGYAPRLGINAGGAVRFGPAFFMPFFETTFSMGNALLFDPDEFHHSPVGSGSSYLRLSGSPSWLDVGAKLGARATDRIFVEGFFKNTLWGTRAAAFWQMGLNVAFRFDFFVPDTRTRAREVPFESNPDVMTDRPVQ